MEAVPSYDVLLAEWRVKQARKQLRESKKALAAARAAAPPAPEEAEQEELFVPEEVEEAAAPAPPMEDVSPLLAALGLLPAAPPAVEEVEEVEVEEVPQMDERVKERKISATTVLAVLSPEESAERSYDVSNGRITQPLWGTARYVPCWRTGKKHDPSSALYCQIRQEIRNGTNTKRTIQEALGVPMKSVDAAVREMSKMGLVLLS